MAALLLSVAVTGCLGDDGGAADQALSLLAQSSTLGLSAEGAFSRSEVLVASAATTASARTRSPRQRCLVEYPSPASRPRRGA
jgi:hypothetical protein